MWGDVVLHKEPEILGQLKKNIIIMDWNYSQNSSAKIQEAYLRVRANGSRAIGAPALIRYIWGPRAGGEQLRNIDAYAEAYLGSNDPSSLGVILTNWVPSRYIQNSLWDGFAYAAVAFNQGTATAQSSGLRRFVERHYQSKWNETWDEAFHLMYDNAPYVEDRESSSWMGLRLPIPWSDDGELTALLKEKVPRRILSHDFAAYSFFWNHQFSRISLIFKRLLFASNIWRMPFGERRSLSSTLPANESRERLPGK